jgi:dienelactone hydrolase
MRALALTVLLAFLAVAAPASADPVVDVDMSCWAHAASDPAPGTPEWQARDAHNQYCASLRLRDQYLSPAFGWGNQSQGVSQYVEQWADQLSEPAHPHGGVTSLVPGSKAPDPFRTVKRWTGAGRGRVAPVRFKATNGSVLRGHVFAPPASVPKPKAGFPGVVITDGSVQAIEELYFWAAEDLAEAGYVVMTYDVQGQGDSDLFGEDCPGDCTGVPYQQDYNFYQGAEDSLGFFLSDRNPFADMLNRGNVGIAGHSLGAAAVSHVGQCDTRVKTIVAWDNLDPIKDCAGIKIPDRYRAKKLIHTSALGLTADYLFNPQPNPSPPDPHGKDDGYKQVAAAGVDSMIVTLRGSTHLEYSYIPAILPASELGERMASYYTQAWFDLKLKHRRNGFARLVAAAFDDSADEHSTGAGIYDVTAADPTDPYSGNVPYRIKGIPVRDAVSFYYRSRYSLHDPRSGAAATCDDMRAGC